MKYLAAYLLASIGGNKSPSEKDILKILEAGGLDCDMENAKKVSTALSGKSIPELIESGKKQLVTFAGAGPAAGGAAPAAGKGASPAAEAPKAETKKKEEVKEESDDDMGFGLFD
ncbi:hypothetical protein WR25_15414 [Diploscapter pachys]|uniref:Large ribosomal subunit protein P2 n=1 Tax=Diploscapter pachys TaxID=2018661 RepID=A0A2A2LN30_9BILA|nr:hypothetical protein WR25_15414 [Diploscapter pachys]